MSTHSIGDPDDSATDAPPPLLEEDVHDVLTPMGEVDSLGSFARGLGARRVKFMIVVFGGLAMMLALLAAVG